MIRKLLSAALSVGVAVSAATPAAAQPLRAAAAVSAPAAKLAAPALGLRLPTSPITAPSLTAGLTAPGGANLAADQARPEKAAQATSLEAAEAIGRQARQGSAREDGQWLSSAFDGTKPGSSDAAPRGAPSGGEDYRQLAPSHDASAERPAPQPPRPARQSLGRAARVGFVAANVALGMFFVANIVANLAHYHFHPGYQPPVDVQHLSLLGSLLTLLMASVIAPVAEEILFRWGVMGALRRLTGSQVWVPMIGSALLFTAVHELRDPVLFAVRFIGALIFARVYQKEGLAASIAMHGSYNGLLFLPAVLAAAFGPALGGLLGLAVAPAAVATAVIFHNWLKAHKPESGQSARPYQIGPAQAWWLAGLLVASAFTLMPSSVWLAAALAWVFYAVRLRRRA